jgi:hypothetical protein
MSEELLKVLRDYREYTSIDEVNWIHYVLQIFHVLGFETTEVEKDNYRLSSIGDGKNQKAIALVLSPSVRKARFANDFQIEAELGKSLRKYNSIWGIFCDGHELQVYKQNNRVINLSGKWVNLDEIIKEHKVIPFFIIVRIMELVRSTAGSMPGPHSY